MGVPHLKRIAPNWINLSPDSAAAALNPAARFAIRVPEILGK